MRTTTQSREHWRKNWQRILSEVGGLDGWSEDHPAVKQAEFGLKLLDDVKTLLDHIHAQQDELTFKGDQ